MSFFNKKVKREILIDKISEYEKGHQTLLNATKKKRDSLDYINKLLIYSNKKLKTKAEEFYKINRCPKCNNHIYTLIKCNENYSGIYLECNSCSKRKWFKSDSIIEYKSFIDEDGFRGDEELKSLHSTISENNIGIQAYCDGMEAYIEHLIEWKNLVITDQEIINKILPKKFHSTDNYINYIDSELEKQSQILNTFNKEKQNMMNLDKVVIKANCNDIKKSNNRRENISQDVKDKVWNRDGGKCIECGSNENLEFDHIIPHSKGGANTYRNLQLLCEPCNRSKSAKIG